MHVRSIATRHRDSGGRSCHFVKPVAEDGVVGRSEYSERPDASGAAAHARDSQLRRPAIPGWSAGPNEAALAKHPPG